MASRGKTARAAPSSARDTSPPERGKTMEFSPSVSRATASNSRDVSASAVAAGNEATGRGATVKRSRVIVSTSPASSCKHSGAASADRERIRSAAKPPRHAARWWKSRAATCTNTAANSPRTTYGHRLHRTTVGRSWRRRRRSTHPAAGQTLRPANCHRSSYRAQVARLPERFRGMRRKTVDQRRGRNWPQKSGSRSDWPLRQHGGKSCLWAHGGCAASTPSRDVRGSRRV